MISVALLLQIAACATMCAAIVYQYSKIKQLEGKIESLKEHSAERMAVLSMEVSNIKKAKELEAAANAEERAKAIAAERAFTEGVANLLNFDVKTSFGKGIEQ
jgi:hypothetical protein